MGYKYRAVEGMVSLVDLNALKGKRVLVTGDTGFKGSWLCLWLSELGAEVTGVALQANSQNTLFLSLAKAELLQHIDCDIRDQEVIQRVIVAARPEVVFHLAAQALVRVSYLEPQTTFATNLLGSVNILEAVRACESINALVFITSDKCYLNKEWLWGYRENDELGGRDPYSASKACAELAFRAYRESFFAKRRTLGAASARAGNVIGGGDRSADRIIPDAIASLEAGVPIAVRNPGSTRPWQHALDPLCGYLKLAIALACDPMEFSGAWNFGPDERSIRTVDDLAREAVTAWGGGQVVHHLEDNAPHESTLLYLSSEKARRLLGWQPRWDFTRAVYETVAWYRAVYEGGSPLTVSRRQIKEYMAELAT
jgi:CDP-glucose 4,6-dehydratase